MGGFPVGPIAALLWAEGATVLEKWAGAGLECSAADELLLPVS